MIIIRKYKKLNWFDFLDRLKKDLSDMPGKSVYIEILDEIHMRKLESISEGGSYKLIAPAKSLLEAFKKRMLNDPTFASEKELVEIKRIVASILK